MLVKNKINLKFFLVSTLIANGFVYYLSNSTKELIVFIAIHVASLVSLLMLYLGGLELKRVAMSKNSEKTDKFKVIFMFIGKILVLFLALSFGVHFIGNRIIIPLLNYVLHIFILAISLRNRET